MAFQDRSQWSQLTPLEEARRPRRLSCIVKFRIKWNVQVPFVFDSEEKSQSLQSSKLYYHPYSGMRLKLHLFNKGAQISICVCHYNYEEENEGFYEPVKVKMSILNRRGHQIHSEISATPSFPIEFLLNKKDIIQSECQQSDNSYTFYCKVFAGQDTPEISEKFIAQDLIIFEKMMKFREHAETFDVIIKAGGREYPAHKNILVSRCIYFNRMIREHPGIETIIIADVDPEVFVQLLRFIYTGALPLEIIGPMAAALFIAVDKYRIWSSFFPLKSHCLYHLAHRMSPLNCAELLLRCDLIDPPENLKESLNAATKFFQRSSTQVMETDKWKKMTLENPRLVCDVLKFMFLQ
jgi:speckle-type POZ protein